jgi:hypothetical protein
VTALLNATSLLAEDAPADSAEIRDAILMLDAGPLLVRLRVAVGGKSPEDARAAAIERIITGLDANHDGKLSRQEAQQSPLFREKRRPGAEAFIKSIQADMTMSPLDVRKRAFGTETVVYRQNTDSSDTDDQVFRLLDSDTNGTITEAEMFNAVDLLLARDGDDDECVTLNEFSPTPAPDPAALQVVAPPTEIPRSKSVAEIIRDTHQTLLPDQLMLKYDKDRNRKLSAAELAWSPERVAPCDANGDGQLDRNELRALSKSPPDVELAVDVVRREGSPMMKVINVLGDRTDEGKYPDLVTVRLPSAIVSFSTKDIDPFEASMTFALRLFNQLEVDANGYLDRDETMVQAQFDRGMFDKIDGNTDNKIFGDEMKEYIRANGEPVATTCHVTAYDDGAGFFATLDTNGDRRVSTREMRYADKSLASMQKDGDPGLALAEPARRYRVEFVRGSYNPFVPPDGPGNVATVANAVARPRPVGPIWFQRWDRNNDGDITWREFLGPRDAFETLDVDRDDLIDPVEAEAASKLAKSPQQNAQAPVNDSSSSAGEGPMASR